MKQAAVIVFFCLSRVLAQVGPPDLRCLEVLLNGDVKLTWIPPSDPSNQFVSYEIFSSISSAGPYTIVSGTIAPISVTTAVHAGATANFQSRYYYMVTRYGVGSQSSASSDTLRTMLLNVNSSFNDLKLTYNYMHVPKLPSATGNFTITKEYPIGTIKNLGTTPLPGYADTIAVCHAKINYQVTLADNSGCISKSNLIIGDYNDTKIPDTTRVDSISVLPNGNTILAWSVPRDEDVNRYYIVEYVPPGPNQYIDSVNGRSSRSYTLANTSANGRPVALYVSALDSCNKIGNFDQRPVTMYLQTAYDQCGYKTSLVWTEYQGMRGGLLEYRIYYSVNGGDFKRIASVNTNSFTHQNVEPGANICYFIRAVNKEQSITASSNRSCFFSRQVNSPAFIYLRNATVPQDKSVRIDVLIDNSKSFTGIDVMRSENGTEFMKAGSITGNGDDSYTFRDATAQPTARSYYYRCIVRDSCGNPRGASNTARTIFLRLHEDKDLVFKKSLSWNAYEGYAGGVSGYNVYRMINGEIAGALIGTTGRDVTFYNDDIEIAAAKGAKIEYMVQAVEGIGNPYGIQDHSDSNPAPVYMEGTIFVPNAFAPDGINKIWRPVTHFIDKNEYKVRVFDRWGHQIFESANDEKGWDGGDVMAGVYVYLINYKNARGEYMQLKGTVTLVR